MRAGQLRHHLVVERDSGQQADALNQPIENWTFFRKVWGAVLQQESPEAIRAAQMQSSSVFQVRTRYFPCLNERMRIRWGTKILYLTGPPRLADQGKQTIWEFTCKEQLYGHQNHDAQAGRA